MALFNNWHKMMKTNMWISGQGNLSNIIKQHVLNRSIVVFQKHQYAMFIQLFVWFFKLKDIFWSSKFDLQKTRIDTDLLRILWQFHSLVLTNESILLMTRDQSTMGKLGSQAWRNQLDGSAHPCHSYLSETVMTPLRQIKMTSIQSLD